MALLQGHHVVLMGRFDAERTLGLIAERRVTWLYVVPTMNAGTESQAAAMIDGVEWLADPGRSGGWPAGG